MAGIMQTGKMFGIDFRPEFTPTGIPVLICFRVEGRPYVVDVDGILYALMVQGDDPDMWIWQVFSRL